MSRFSATLHLIGREGTRLFTFEVVATLYFGVLAAVSPFSGASRRWAGVAAALSLAAMIIAMSRLLFPAARVWLAHLYLAAGYWLPALLVARPPHRFEAWLRRTEPAWHRLPTARTLPGAARTLWVRDISELAYLCCYPLVPAAFIVIYMTGSIEEVSRYWTSVFIAGFACYVSLPWLVSRPPHVIERREEDTVAPASSVRRLNIRVLERLSHGWNTFPSGHVAVACAAALTTIVAVPRAGIAFAIVAAGIAIGSVVGRYHYMIDAIAGVVVGFAAWAISTMVRPWV